MFKTIREAAEANDTLKILFSYYVSAFNSGVIYEFKGRRIYQNDDLAFGEVNIRLKHDFKV